MQELARLMACWLDSWLEGRIPFPHNRVETLKFLLQVVKGFCVFEHIITRVKSEVFFGFFFDADFFKSIIDLEISMSGHLFLRRIFWELVCLRVATGGTENYKEPKHIVPT